MLAQDTHFYLSVPISCLYIYSSICYSNFSFCIISVLEMIFLNLTSYTNKVAVGGALLVLQLCYILRYFTAPSCFGTVSSLFLGTYEPSNEFVWRQNVLTRQEVLMKLVRIEYLVKQRCNSKASTWIHHGISLFSHFRLRDATRGNSFFQMSSYARANVRITNDKNKRKIPMRASRGLKWENKTYKLKKSIIW